MATLGFTPDGKEIIFQDDMIDTALGSYAGPYDFPPSTAYPDGYHSDFVVWHPVFIVQSVNIADGTVRTLAREATNAVMSPDGRYLAYDWYSWKGMAVTDTNPPHGMKVLDLKTGESRILDSEGYGPCFTPDSKYVIYSLTNVNSGNVLQSSINLYRIPVAGGTPEQITFTKLDQPIPGVYNPRVSPDGEWILFFYRTSPQSTIVYQHLCVFNTKTKEAFQFFPDTDKSVEDAQWSPDGNKVAYTLKSYDSTDAELNGKTSIYIIDFPTASMSRLQPTAVSDAAPIGFALTGNYPNPFNPTTTISFTLPASGAATLSVYSITGQKVRELVSGHLSAGVHSVVWDGLDASGKQVSSGVYLSRLSMGNHTAAGRMLLAK
jgi:Tol biopolymer transport system component